MVAHTSTVILHGIQSHSVDVQVQITPGLPSFQIVGLPNSAIRESKERVRGAFHALGFSLPAKRITVNLSPANLNKEGSHIDFPIAVALLIALKVIPQDSAERALFMGEIALDGTLTPTTGALPSAIHGVTHGFDSLYLPTQNAAEAAWAEGINVYAIGTLTEFLRHIKGEEVKMPTKPLLNMQEREGGAPLLDMRDIKGQESLKRAAEIAMAGGHNMLMCGAPGSGKSMLAARLNTLSAPLSASEALEVSMVHSIAGMIGKEGLVTQKPFREPHHSASAVALCGGGLKAGPGEMSLAHRGILFLDELPEFPRPVLETLRQPLESGEITVSRANHHVTYPSRFQLIAAMNPCPCGYSGHPKVKCTCTPHQVLAYKNRLSGPLLDRIDIHVYVEPVQIRSLSLPSPKEGSADIKARIEVAQKIQEERYKDTPFKRNAELAGKALEDFMCIDSESQDFFTRAAEKYNLSARAYHRTLKVARTIADLEGSEPILKGHLIEALAYRPQV